MHPIMLASAFLCLCLCLCLCLSSVAGATTTIFDLLMYIPTGTCTYIHTSSSLWPCPSALAPLNLCDNPTPFPGTWDLSNVSQSRGLRQAAEPTPSIPVFGSSTLFTPSRVLVHQLSNHCTSSASPFQHFYNTFSTIPSLSRRPKASIPPCRASWQICSPAPRPGSTTAFCQFHLHHSTPARARTMHIPIVRARQTETAS